MKIINVGTVTVSAQSGLSVVTKQHEGCVMCCLLSTESSGADHRVASDQSESPYPRQPPAHAPEPPSDKQWNYSGLDLMGSGAAFWQNYSG